MLLQETKAAKVRFRRKDDFHRRLQAEVGELLVGSAGRARRQLAAKVVATSAWFYGTYLCLVLVDLRLWQAIVLTVSLGLAGAAVAMGTAHDAVHGTLSPSRRRNIAIALVAAPFGISPTWWSKKHNMLHHSFTNVDVVDDDLHFGRILRLTPHQPWHRWHRYQHRYVWLLYPLLYLAMMLNGDLAFITRGVIGTTKVAEASLLRGLRLVVEKLTGLVMILGLAFATHSVVAVLAVYLSSAMLAGLVMAVVFQTGHCLDSTTFLKPDAETGRLDSGWALAQLAGTADVAPSNWLYTTFTGGLNHHIAHHLFPHASQLLLPRIGKVVRRHCDDSGVALVVFPTVRSAVASHQRHLCDMGRPPT